MEAVGKKRVFEGLEKLSRGIEKDKEPSTTIFLENYLYPVCSWPVEGGYSYARKCRIGHPDFDFDCTLLNSRENPTLKFCISTPYPFALPSECVLILFGFDGIYLVFKRFGTSVSLEYSTIERCVKIILYGHEFIVTNRNRKLMGKLINPRLPPPMYGLGNFFNIKNVEELILSYRCRTKIALQILCPDLPDYICSAIWDLAISDVVLSSKLICGFVRLLDDALEDRKQHWLKNMSQAISKILIEVKSSEMSYLLEESCMKTVDFEPVGHFLKGI